MQARFQQDVNASPRQYHFVENYVDMICNEKCQHVENSDEDNDTPPPQVRLNSTNFGIMKTFNMLLEHIKCLFNI